MKKIVILLILVMSIFHSTPAVAIPSIDWKTDLSWAANMVTRIANYYIVARSWRDNAIGKAKALTDQAEQLVQMRRDFEANAYGELAGLGKGIPDWQDYTNHCEITVKGKSICNVDTQVRSVIQDVVFGEIEKLETKFFTSMDSVALEIENIAGSTAHEALAIVDAKAFGRNDIISYDAKIGLEMERIAEEATEMADSIVKEENLEESVSSGRADQIALAAMIMQANLDAMLAEAAIRELQSKVYATMDIVQSKREKNLPVFRGIQ